MEKGSSQRWNHCPKNQLIQGPCPSKLLLEGSGIQEHPLWDKVVPKNLPSSPSQVTAALQPREIIKKKKIQNQKFAYLFLKAWHNLLEDFPRGFPQR